MTTTILETLETGHITGTLAICIKGLCKTIEQLEQRVSFLEASSTDFLDAEYAETGLWGDGMDPSIKIDSTLPICDDNNDWAKNLPDASERAKQMLAEERELQKKVSIDEEVVNFNKQIQALNNLNREEYVKYVRHGGVLVDVFEHVDDATVLAHAIDLARADWEKRADAWFEVTDFDEYEYNALKSWLAVLDLSRDNAELTAFVEQEVKVYAKKEGVVSVYIDQFSTYTNPVDEPFVRITVYRRRV